MSKLLLDCLRDFEWPGEGEITCVLSCSLLGALIRMLTLSKRSTMKRVMFLCCIVKYMPISTTKANVYEVWLAGGIISGRACVSIGFRPLGHSACHIENLLRFRVFRLILLSIFQWDPVSFE